MRKKIFLADLLESQYLFEKLHTSDTVESSENVVKRWKFQKIFAMECKNVNIKLIRPEFV